MLKRAQDVRLERKSKDEIGTLRDHRLKVGMDVTYLRLACCLRGIIAG